MVFDGIGVTLNFVSGCLWVFGLRGNVFDWVERVTLFGDELPPFHKLLGLFSIFRLPILRAAFFMRACEIACAEEKFAYDFAADKFEMLFEQLDPCFFAARVVGI